MNKLHLTDLIKHAIWRFSMTWHYLLAMGIILLFLVVATGLSIKYAILAFILLFLCFTLMDVPLERTKHKGLKSRSKKQRSTPSSQKQTTAALIEALPDPVLILDETHHLVFTNEAARNLFNITASGLDISAVIRAPNFLEALTEVAETKTSRTIQLLERVPIERQFSVTISWIAAKSKKDKKQTEGDLAMMAYFHDLTEQERLNRMRSDFIANASHELRTPLASLLGFIETLQGPARHDEAAREKFLKVMATQGKRMTRLIDDLLSLSRIEMNAHKRPKDQVDLVNIIGNTIDVLAPLADEQNITIHLETSAEKVITKGHRDELAQVFQNLIHNAIKYGQTNEEEAIIQIRIHENFEEGTSQGSSRQQDNIRVEIQDFGSGIDPVHIPRLTERFYRVDVKQSREKGGTGLGLAIAKHIVSHHQGQLKIRSKPGEGSTFTVILPTA